MLERRSANHSYLYVCRICKGGRAAAAAAANAAMSPRFNEDSNDNWATEVDPLAITSTSSNASGGSGGTSLAVTSSEFENGRLGLGKGKPMAAVLASGGKRGRRGGGYGFVGRPRSGMGYAPIGGAVGWKGSGGGPNKPGIVGSKKRVGDIRRRGRQSKIRGMVGLQARAD